MARNLNFTEGTIVPPQFLNDLQESLTGSIAGLYIAPHASDATKLALVPGGAEVLAPIVLSNGTGGISSDFLVGYQEGTVNSLAASGSSGPRSIWVSTSSAAQVATPGIYSVSILPIGSAPADDYQRRIGGATWNGSLVSNVTLENGVMADANQRNSFTFRSVLNGVGDIPLTIRGRNGQGSSASKMLSVGYDSSGGVYGEHWTVSSTGLLTTTQAASTAAHYQAYVTGDAQPYLSLTNTIALGAGGSSAPDTTISRTSAGVLQISSTLAVATVQHPSSALVAFPTGINITGGSLQISGSAIASTNLSDSAQLARLSSPTFTGTPNAPTASTATNTTQLATTAFVQAVAATITSGVGAGYLPLSGGSLSGSVSMSSATSSLTVASTGTSANASVVANAATGGAAIYAMQVNSTAEANLQATSTNVLLVDKVAAQNILSYTFSTKVLDLSANTSVTSSTPTTGDNTTKVATTAFVATAITNAALTPASATPLMDGSAAVGVSLLYARQDHVHPTDTSRSPLASPTFTGTPAAPTATAGTNTTQVATTAFVTTAVAALAVTGLATVSSPMNGTAAVGTSTLAARQDHVHQSDTSRVAKSGDTMTGSLTTTGSVNVTASATDAFMSMDSSSGGGTRGTHVLLKGGGGTNDITFQTNTTPLFVIQSVTGSGVFAVTDSVNSLNFIQYAPLTKQLDLSANTTVLAPTPTTSDNTTKVATTAFVATAITNASLTPASATPLMDGTAAVGTSLLYARQDHVHPTDTSRAPLASPTFTGTPAAPTPSTADSTTKVATTAYVQANLASYLTSTAAASTYAPLSSPVFSSLIAINSVGTATATLDFRTGGSSSWQIQRLTSAATYPNGLAVVDQTNSVNALTFAATGDVIFAPHGSLTAPTPTTGDNSTKVATTAFVATAISNYVTNDDTFLVSLAGSQTITGGKTFTSGDTQFTDSSRTIDLGALIGMQFKAVGDTYPNLTVNPQNTNITFGAGGSLQTDVFFGRTAVGILSVTKSGAATRAALQVADAPVAGADLTNKTYVDAADALKAPLASPTFIGTPVAPTPTAGDSSTTVATTAFVATSFAPLASPSLTGNPTAPTQTAGNSSTRLATTAFVATSFAPLASPTFTGIPAAPTATAGTSTTQIASTSFVTTAITNAATDVQIFTSSGTWTKPTGAKLVEIIAIGGGGGGASTYNITGIGGNVSTYSHMPGAGGGGGGGWVRRVYGAGLFGSTEIVTVGAGGSGAIPVTTGGGAAGGNGGTSSVTATNATSSGSPAIQAGGGSGGQPTTTSGYGNGGPGGVGGGGSPISDYPTSAGGYGGAADSAAPALPTNYGPAPGGGGGGGGSTAATSTFYAGAAGVTGDTSGLAGNDSTGSSSHGIFGGSGGSGGTNGSGFSGSKYGAGGGGGAPRNSGNGGGSGGSGAAGAVMIISYF